jgi:hypothetical protein
MLTIDDAYQPVSCMSVKALLNSIRDSIKFLLRISVGALVNKKEHVTILNKLLLVNMRVRQSCIRLWIFGKYLNYLVKNMIRIDKMDIPLYSLPPFRWIYYQLFRCIAYRHSEGNITRYSISKLTRYSGAKFTICNGSRLLTA